MPTYTTTHVFYDDFKEQLVKGTHNFASNTLKMGLVTSTYSPSALHDELADITNEVSGSGYARQTLANVVVTETAGVATIDCDDIVFAASGGNITARRFFLYNDTATNDKLISYGLLNNADVDVVITDGNSLTYVVAAGGLFTVG